MDDNTDANSKIWNLIQKIRFAMMTTEDDGLLRSRPMAAANRDFDGTLWYFTRASSHKVEEIAEDERVCLSYADPDSQTYVSLSGAATLVRDPEAVKAHWSESVRVWFPKGKDDPDIALLRVEVEQAEYWDVPSSTMVTALGYAKAVLTGRSPHPGDHGKVTL